MRKSKASRTLTACWSELGMLAPCDGIGKKNWSDRAKRCWTLLISWLEEDKTRIAYNFDRGGTSQFEERARSFVDKYGPIIWPASNTDPQCFAYPRNVDGIVLRVQDLVCHRIENKWAYTIEKHGNLGNTPGGEVISTNEVGVGDLAQKPQPPKVIKRRRWEMSEDGSDHAVPRTTKWIGPPKVNDSDSLPVMTEGGKTEAYMREHQVLLKKRKANAHVSQEKTTGDVGKKTIDGKTTKEASSQNTTTSRYTGDYLGWEESTPPRATTPAPRAVPAATTLSVATGPLVQAVYASNIPQVATHVPSQVDHASKTSPPMGLDLSPQPNHVALTPPPTVPDLPGFDPKHLAKAILPVELVGISNVRMLHLYEFDSPQSFSIALQILWELRADDSDVDHVGAKFAEFDGIIELRKWNADDFRGLMIMTAKWLNTLKPNEIPGICPNIIIKIYKNTAVEFQ